MKKSNNKNTWKSEQIFYFKEYIKAFSPETEEYKKIAKGIKELEGNI